jgi:hypothetical protein
VQKPPPPVERPKGHIQLKTSPPGATVLIDDDLQKHLTPTAIEGIVGENYHLTLTLAGYKKHEEEIVFAAEERPLLITLDKVDEAPVQHEHHHTSSTPKKDDTPKLSGKGTISIFVHPAATVFVDGQRLRQTPIANYEIAAGKHTFKLVNEGLKKDEDHVVVIKPGSNDPIRVEWAK